jgi:hypothetical protein
MKVRLNGQPFSPTEQRIFDVLSDGLMHSQSELVQAIDELASRKTLTVHLVSIRDKLERKGTTVVAMSRGTAPCMYRWVRLISMD